MKQNDKRNPEETKSKEAENPKKRNPNQSTGQKHNDGKENHRDEWPYLEAYIS